MRPFDASEHWAIFVLYRSAMKRHPSLIPLSHDHHHTLVLAQGLIVGQSRAPRSNWPTERRKQADRVIEFFVETLQSHLKNEEAEIFPLAERRLPSREALIFTLRQEHEQIRSLVSDLERNLTNNLEERLPILGRLLERNVRQEERVLFQAIQEELTESELKTLGSRLAQSRRQVDSCRLINTTRNNTSSTDQTRY